MTDVFKLALCQCASNAACADRQRVGTSVSEIVPRQVASGKAPVSTGKSLSSNFADAFLGAKSLPKILRRVAYPVEPFGFAFAQNDLPPPLLDGNRDRLGERPGLIDQLDDCQANELQCVHRRMQQFSLNSPQIAAIS